MGLCCCMPCFWCITYPYVIYFWFCIRWALPGTVLAMHCASFSMVGLLRDPRTHHAVSASGFERFYWLLWGGRGAFIMVCFGLNHSGQQCHSFWLAMLARLGAYADTRSYIGKRGSAMDIWKQDIIAVREYIIVVLGV